MKKLTVVIIVLFSLNVKAQWVQTNGPYSGFGISCLTKVGNTLLVGGTFGVYISKDSGKTWTEKSNGLPQFGALSMTSSDSIVYVGTHSGVYFSSDNYSTWQKIDKDFTKPISDIIVADSNLVVTATDGAIYYKNENMSDWKGYFLQTYKYFPEFISLGKLNDLLFAGSYTGEIALSTDNGANWRVVKDSYNRGRINCFASDKDKIYAGFDGGVFLSTDKGINWTIYRYGLTDSTIMSLTSFDDKIFAGTYKGVFVSTNKGDTWSKAGLSNSQIISFTDLNNELFTCSFDLGISKTIDNGRNWVQTNSGLEQYWDVGNITSLDDKLYVGTQRGIFTSSNNGQDWRSAFNNDGFLVKSLTTKGDCIFAAHDGNGVTNFGGLYISLNKGLDWSQIQSFDFYNNSSIHFSVLLSHNEILYNGNNTGIWSSSDLGKNWVQTSYKKPNVDVLSTEVFSFAVSDSFIYAGNRTGVFVTKDSWQTLKQINTGFPDLPWIVSLAASGKDVWAGTWSKGLYHSNNIGENWNKMDVPVLGKVTSINIINKMVFVTSDSSGIFVSKDNGASWKQINTGLKSINVRCLYPFDNNLYIGIANKGVWSRPLSEITSIEKDKVEIPTTFSLSQNYPNPFNPETTIEYSIPKSEHVTLKIYDLLGREVATLVNEFKQAGTYNSKLITQNYKLTSGVYFYRLQAGSYSQTKKLILMK